MKSPQEYIMAEMDHQELYDEYHTDYNDQDGDLRNDDYCDEVDASYDAYYQMEDDDTIPF